MPLEKTAFERLLLQLPQLSSEQRSAVSNRIKFLQGSGQPTKRPPLSEDWLLDSLLAELKRRGLLSGRPPNRILAQMAPDYYDQAQEAWQCLLNGVSDQPLNPQQQWLLAQRAAWVYIGRLTRRPGFLVNVGSVLRNISMLPQLFDEAFPGYLEHKLVPLILTSSFSSETVDDE